MVRVKVLMMQLHASTVAHGRQDTESSTHFAFRDSVVMRLVGHKHTWTNKARHDCTSVKRKHLQILSN